MEDFDIAIVGARVAGATLAALFGDRGYRVLLLDSAPLPSSTLPTHFVRGGRAGRVLQELGLVERVLALGAPPLTCEYRYSAGASEPAVLGPARSW
jgi:2-polyprenyl-6-methoxyphenol hydroxylase-like FAD-dependent oxidoreductase